MHETYYNELGVNGLWCIYFNKNKRAFLNHFNFIEFE